MKSIGKWIIAGIKNNYSQNREYMHIVRVHIHTRNEFVILAIGNTDGNFFRGAEAIW